MLTSHMFAWGDPHGLLTVDSTVSLVLEETCGNPSVPQSVANSGRWLRERDAVGRCRTECDTRADTGLSFWREQVHNSPRRKGSGHRGARLPGPFTPRLGLGVRAAGDHGEEWDGSLGAQGGEARPGWPGRPGDAGEQRLGWPSARPPWTEGDPSWEGAVEDARAPQQVPEAQHRPSIQVAGGKSPAQTGGQTCPHVTSARSRRDPGRGRRTVKSGDSVGTESRPSVKACVSFHCIYILALKSGGVRKCVLLYPG